MQKRRDNLCWAIHGGGVEIGEKVEDAAKRELFEETGLIANKLELLGVFSGENMMYTYPNGDEVCIIGINYICRDFSGELQPITDETLELKWFDINKLPFNISPPDIEPLNSFVKYVLFKADTEEELTRIQALEASELNEAINAYNSVTASPEFQELERMRVKAQHDEAQALWNAEKKKAKEIAIKLLQKKMTIDEIIEITGLTHEEIAVLRDADN